MAEIDEVIQAASMLCSILGARAPDAAASRARELEEQGDQIGAAQWRLIHDEVLRIVYSDRKAG